MTAVPRAHSHVQYCVCIVMRTGSVLSLLCNACAVSTAAKKTPPSGAPLVLLRWSAWKNKRSVPFFFFFSRPRFSATGVDVSRVQDVNLKKILIIKFDIKTNKTLADRSYSPDVQYGCQLHQLIFRSAVP